jgi:RNase P/RNase MRP subunit POP5
VPDSERGAARPRRRYVAFVVHVVSDGPGAPAPPPGREALTSALDAACEAAGLPRARRLTVFDGRRGIARCAHRELDALVAALRSIREAGGTTVRLETLATSGTIKKAKAHLVAWHDR